MSQQYLVPLTRQTLGSDNFTTTAPEYFSTDMAGLPFTCIPYGGETVNGNSIGIVSLQAANAKLASEADVYTFPADLTTLLQDSDVTTLGNFLTAWNIPTDSVVAGAAFSDVLQSIARVFLVAQALFGALQTAIFTNGATLDSAVSDTGVAAIAPTLQLGSTGKLAGGSGGGSQPAPPTIPYFDFSQVAASDNIGDTLNVVSAQFVGPVNLGEIA